MTGQELSEWFGISYKSTYCKKPSYYIKKLANYAEYEQIRGGVNIKEIYVPVYNKKLKFDQTKTYLTNVIKEKGIISLNGLKKTTGLSVYHSRTIRNELFGGKPTNIDPAARGKIGARAQIWAIKLGPNSYRRLTAEEEELFNNLIEKEYLNETPEGIKQKQLILNYCIQEELSAEDYNDLLTENNGNFFNDVLQKFKMITGYQITAPTEHVILQSWGWDADLDENYKTFMIKILKEQVEDFC